MPVNEIQDDLILRRQSLQSVTAYSKLRVMVDALCYVYIALVALWLLTNLVIISKHGGLELSLHFLPFLAAMISIVFALVIKGLAQAFLDGQDLKLLENRRSELNRKAESKS